MLRQTRRGLIAARETAPHLRAARPLRVRPRARRRRRRGGSTRPATAFVVENRQPVGLRRGRLRKRGTRLSGRCHRRDWEPARGRRPVTRGAERRDLALPLRSVRQRAARPRDRARNRCSRTRLRASAPRCLEGPARTCGCASRDGRRGASPPHLRRRRLAVRLLPRHDGIAQHADPLDLRLDHVPRLQVQRRRIFGEARDPADGARGDDVAR